MGRFVYKNNGEWLEEDMGGFDPWSSTVAVDAAGDVHGMTQWSWGTGLYQGFLWYVWRNDEDGTWEEDPFGDAPFIPYNPHASMVIDSNGNPHLSVTASEGLPLGYWGFVDQRWTHEELVNGVWSSIALDDQDIPRISFYDPLGEDLLMALQMAGSWQIVPLDQAGDVGLYTSHAYRDGASHITYYDATLGDLKYLVFDSQGVDIYTVDAVGDVGAWSSLALDALGNPHIAYLDATNGALKYARADLALPVEEKTLGRTKWMFRQK
jgi:hypothetical protein